MKLDFRIDWGYQYLYSRRHYHPVYLWDGRMTAWQAGLKKLITGLPGYLVWPRALCARDETRRTEVEEPHAQGAFRCPFRGGCG